jgi:hypothetical protein
MAKFNISDLLNTDKITKTKQSLAVNLESVSDKGSDFNTKLKGLNLDLESVEIKEHIKKAFSEDLYDKIASTFAINHIVNEVIKARTMDTLTEDVIQEVKAMQKQAIRHGIKTFVKVCPEGFKVDGTNCVKQTPMEIRINSKRAKLAAKKRKMRPHVGALKSMKKSMMMRNRLPDTAFKLKAVSPAFR